MKELKYESYGYKNEDFTHHENMFLTGNGYMGVRGTLCEYSKEYMPTINLGCVYEQVQYTRIASVALAAI